MALPIRQQAVYWGIATVIFFALLWALGDVILPFLVGGAIAYFLDPVADRLENLGLSRTLATVLIAIVAVLVFMVSAGVLIPMLVQQTVELSQAVPALLKQFQTFLAERYPSLEDPTSSVHQYAVQIGEVLQSRAGDVAKQVFTSALSVLNAVVFLVVAPVVAFYLLLDWDNMVAKINGLLPLDHAPTIRQVASDVDKVMAGFVRGQLSVCLILGAFYAITLMVVGLNFGLVVGVIAGLLTFIPYVGSIVGGALAIGLAIFQFWGDPHWIAIVAGIFVAGQMLEGNFLTPKLVGGSVGLHPVWLLFALSAFGSVFGFVGMLVAVPVAAMLGVLTRFGVRQYQGGRLYKGEAGRDQN